MTTNTVKRTVLMAARDYLMLLNHNGFPNTVREIDMATSMPDTFEHTTKMLNDCIDITTRAVLHLRGRPLDHLRDLHLELVRSHDTVPHPRDGHS